MVPQFENNETIVELSKVLDKLSAPKRIIRDENGVIIGSETVED